MTFTSSDGSSDIDSIDPKLLHVAREAIRVREALQGGGDGFPRRAEVKGAGGLCRGRKELEMSTQVEARQGCEGGNFFFDEF